VGGSLFLIELGSVVILLAILARVAQRAGFSPMPLYLIAGLAFGEGGLVPLVTAEGFIELGAQFGLVLLLFSLGLQFSVDEFTVSLKTNGSAGAVDALLTFVPGVLGGLLLGFEPLDAVLLGGVAYNTSSSVVARIMDELGWFGNRESPTVMAITVLEDLAMAAYLPIITILLTGDGVAAIVTSVALAIIVVLGALAVATRFGPGLSRVVFSRSDEALLLGMIGVGLLVAGGAQRLGISAGIGAFLAGIVFSGPAADRTHYLLRPMRDVFAGVFFLFFGFQIDPAAIPPVAVQALVLSAVGIAGKYATGHWAARRQGMGPRARRRAGALLTPRGEFSIVIAGLAVAGGSDPSLGPLAASYVLVTAVSGPIFARVIDRAPAGAPPS